MIGILTAVGLGILTGRVFGMLINRRARQGTPEEEPRPALEGREDERLRGLPCTLGDVVVLAHGEEAWLAGALLLRERVAHRDEGGDATRTASALFVGPDGAVQRAVFARPAPDASLDWMWPVPPEALVIGAEPPSALEHDGERFERVRRTPLALVGVGADPPDLGATGVVGEYQGGGGARLLIVVGTGGTRAWRGRRLEAGMYEVLPGTTSSVASARPPSAPPRSA